MGVKGGEAMQIVDIPVIRSPISLKGAQESCRFLGIDTTAHKVLDSIVLSAQGKDYWFDKDTGRFDGLSSAV
ncbi:unnamed protein product [marine sediment metagenome]|uniref:Uncharacterized protein n=1 Tax=marine sediment metagenome TaxID=412755 RepID=X1BVC7_9ZZZZ